MTAARASAARRRLRLVVADATSGVLAFTGVSLCVLALVLAVALRTPTMLPGWADPLNLSLTASMIFAPAAAGIAAVHAGQLERSRVLGLSATAPDGPWRVLALGATAVLTWTVLAQVVFTGLVLLGADLSGPLSRAMWLLPIQGLVLIALAVLVGTAVGARLTSYLTGPGLALAVYAVLFRLDVSGSRLSPVYTDIYYQVRFEPNARLLLGVCLLLVTLSLGVLALGLRGPVSVGRGVLLAGAGVAASVATSQFALAGPDDTQLRDGGSGSCARSSTAAPLLRLCVWPENRDRLEPSLTALERAAAAAAPVMPVPADYVEPGLDGHSPSAQDFLMPGYGEGGYLGAAVRAIVPTPCSGPTELAGHQLAALVYERLEPGTTVPGLGAVDTARQSVEEQQQWAAERLETMAQCR